MISLNGIFDIIIQTGIIGLLIFPALLFFLFQSFIQFPVKDLRFRNGLFSVIWMEALCLSLAFLTGRAKIVYCIAGVFFMILGIAEAYVFRFRSSFLSPIDIGSVRTAANVAGNYDFTPWKELVTVTGLFAGWFVFLFILCPADIDFILFGDSRIRIITGVIFLAVFVTFTFYVINYDAKKKGFLDISANAFHSDLNNRAEGALIRFLYDCGGLRVKKPDGYSVSEAEKLLEKYRKDPASKDIDPKEYPDIVVVMNESFSDPHSVGPLKTSIDYMPFIHSLQKGHKNTVTGELNVSIQGGNTPNTEYEFLTGNTLAFLPVGCIPFQQYLNRNVDSIPRYLSSIGYDTVAMHPYLSSGWNRTKAYSFLGFKDMKFLEYFEGKDLEIIRKYISDRSFTKVIIDEVEKRNKKKPVFSFNVTMQNHASYAEEYDNLKKDVKITDEKRADHLDELETYLSLLKLSDDAFKEMIEHYEKTDRKTLVVFFGDHQPATVNFEQIFLNLGTNRHDLSDETSWDTYKVPFVIWANYDIEEASDIKTSVNYFGNLMLKAAGIPLDSYRAFTDELSKEAPVITAIRTEDREGNSENLSETHIDLSEYRKLQYYELFDRTVE